jgi:hypothetical protein
MATFTSLLYVLLVGASDLIACACSIDKTPFFTSLALYPLTYGLISSSISISFQPPLEIRRKLVHRPSKTSLYQVFKRQKVVTMAPSELAKPSTYESMQKLSTCRILDDRPEPDLDIPPIPLLYEGFGHFLDIMGGGTDILGLNLVNIRKLQAEVDELACRMCHYYDHEDTRRDAAHPILNRIFAARSGVEIPTIHMDAIGSVKSDGHVLWENGVVTLVTRFKNQALGDNGVVAPDVELVRSITHLHAKQMQVDEELFLGWRVPCLGLTFVGECKHLIFSC